MKSIKLHFYPTTTDIWDFIFLFMYFINSLNSVPLLYKSYISQCYTLYGYKITTKIEVYIGTKFKNQ